MLLVLLLLLNGDAGWYDDWAAIPFDRLLRGDSDVLTPWEMGGINGCETVVGALGSMENMDVSNVFGYAKWLIPFCVFPEPLRLLVGDPPNDELLLEVGMAAMYRPLCY